MIHAILLTIMALILPIKIWIDCTKGSPIPSCLGLPVPTHPGGHSVLDRSHHGDHRADGAVDVPPGSLSQLRTVCFGRVGAPRVCHEPAECLDYWNDPWIDDHLLSQFSGNHGDGDDRIARIRHLLPSFPILPDLRRFKGRSRKRFRPSCPRGGSKPVVCGSSQLCPVPPLNVAETPGLPKDTSLARLHTEFRHSFLVG